jgi:hypothetical protein
MPRRLFLAAIVAGALARAALVRSPGTRDVTAFKIWAHSAVTEGVTHLYGAGGWPPATHTLVWRGRTTHADYPPVALFEIAAAGRAYRAVFPDFPDTPALTVCLKLLAVIASAGLMILLAGLRGPRLGAGAARWAAAAYWCNPAVILHGAALGYLDALAALPAAGAIAAGASGRTALAGALLAIACLTKPQAILAAPALALTLARGSDRRPRLRTAAVSFAAASLIIVSPIAIAGAFANMIAALFHLVTDGMASGNAANVWWIATYARQIANGAPRAAPVLIASVGDMLPSGGAAAGGHAAAAMLAAASWVAVAAIAGWAIAQARPAVTITVSMALAALTVHAYAVVAVQVHENHLALALPLLAVVSASEVRYRALFAAISTVVFLNLNFFYGFGEGVGYALPRAATFIDATVLLAAVNVCALAWHMRLFGSLCVNERRGRVPAGGVR